MFCFVLKVQTLNTNGLCHTHTHTHTKHISAQCGKSTLLKHLNHVYKGQSSNDMDTKHKINEIIIKKIQDLITIHQTKKKLCICAKISKSLNKEEKACIKLIQTYKKNTINGKMAEKIHTLWRTDAIQRAFFDQNALYLGMSVGLLVFLFCLCNKNPFFFKKQTNC